MEGHYIRIDNKEKIIISQVEDVDTFDENTLWANLKDGSIEISGEGLKVEKLDLNEGVLLLVGKVESVIYTEKKRNWKKGLFSFIKGLK